ncbi:MAG: VCBS repeat-containing protein, partial [Planctomycetes bacterium]|nr:VCBS repeat-containing protein [Planctomycetota bacterium]
MKHSRVTAGSFAAALKPQAALLIPLAGLAASLAGALPARGQEVAFTEHVISTAADGAWSVFATDLDGDGDIDVLSASGLDDKIAWYENDGGSPPTFTEHVISANADGAASVFATDLDGDGDTDVLSASFFDDKIAWYENDGGSPPTFTERVISTAADNARSVFAADVDGDGDT